MGAQGKGSWDRMTPRILLDPWRPPPVLPARPPCLPTSTMLVPRKTLSRPLRTLPRLSVSFLPATDPSFVHSSLHTEQHASRSRRWQSTEPPPAGGHLPSVATSTFLKPTRDVALRTAGLRWLDPSDADPARDVVGRETRKMNMYQAIRDALRYAPNRVRDAPPAPDGRVIAFQPPQHRTQQRRYGRRVRGGCGLRGRLPLHHGERKSSECSLAAIQVGTGALTWSLNG